MLSMQMSTLVQQYKYLETLIMTTRITLAVCPGIHFPCNTSAVGSERMNIDVCVHVHQTSPSAFTHCRIMSVCFSIQRVVSCFRIQIEESNRPQKEVKQLNHAVLSYKPVAAHSVNVSNRITYFIVPGCKGIVCSALPSPTDRSKRFTLHLPTHLFIPTPT